MTEKKGMKPLNMGPTGLNVAANVGRRREELDLKYTALEKRLKSLGQAIPTLGLRRIEAGARRVDADELVALAVALEISPLDLLQPGDPSSPLGTAIPQNVSPEEFQAWLSGSLVNFTDGARRGFWLEKADALDAQAFAFGQKQRQWDETASSTGDPHAADIEERYAARHTKACVERDLALERARSFPRNNIDAPWHETSDDDD